MPKAAIPPVVLTYGVAGLVPFLVPPVVAALRPEWRDTALMALSSYAALILSFLGGARWGFDNKRQDSARPGTITLAMLPSVTGLVLLLLPSRGWALSGLAMALAIHWAWDAASPGLPGWYPRLRGLLSAGALLGLTAGAIESRF